MEHNYSKVFDTDNPMWQDVLAIFDIVKNIPAKKTKGRALHHKFPRSFSAILGEPVDNEPNNLITSNQCIDINFQLHMEMNSGIDRC